MNTFCFYCTNPLTKRHQDKFCSIKCLNLWQKGKHHSPKTEFKKGDKGHWKGGKTMSSYGYVLIYSPNHPFPTRGKYVLEHRLTMEKHLKRYLKPTESVHHIDGNKQNNSLNNLIFFPNESAHQKFEQSIKRQARIINRKKYCTKCHKLLPLKNFSKNRQTIIGLRPDCRSCQKQYYLTKKHTHISTSTASSKKRPNLPIR